MKIAVLITCEHASNAIPEILQDHISLREDFQTHLGWDEGAKEIAGIFEFELKGQKRITMLPTQYGEISRLIVDLNRSPENEECLMCRKFGVAEELQQRVMHEWYTPYREKVIRTVTDAIENDFLVIHVAVHTFVPVFMEKKRTMDIGVLFDAESVEERIFADLWVEEIAEVNSTLKVRTNEPYNGADDCLATYFRTHFGSDNYIGIELEVNQLIAKDLVKRAQVAHNLYDALTKAIKSAY